MKRSFYTLIFISAVLSLSAQNITVLDSIYRFQNDWNDNTLKPDIRQYFETDKNGNDTLERVLRYSIDDKKFSNDAKYSRTYSNNLLIKEVQYGYNDFTKKWYANSKVEIAYNVKGLPTQTTQYQRGSGNWYGDTRMTYTYNSSDSLTEMHTEWYQSNSWEPFSREIFRFDNNRRLERRSEMYNTASKEWDTTSQIIDEYVAGNHTIRLRRQNDFTTNIMVDQSIDSMWYEAGKLVKRKQKLYDPFSKVWMDISMDSFFYSAPNISAKINYFGSGKNWSPIAKKEFYTNANGDDTLLINSYIDFMTQKFTESIRRTTRFEDDRLIHQKEVSFDESLGKWITQYDHHYYYSEKTTVGLGELSGNSIRYHNLGGHLIVTSGKSISKLSVYDPAGRLLQTMPANAKQVELALPKLPILLVLVEGKGWTEVLKIPAQM